MWKVLDAPLSARCGRAAPLRGQRLCESPSKQMKFHTTQISEFKKGREVGRGAGGEEGEGGRSCGLAGRQGLMLTPRGRWHPSLAFPLLPLLPFTVPASSGGTVLCLELFTAPWFVPCLLISLLTQ